MSQSADVILEKDALIAPGEIQELVSRLTEQSVEAVPVHSSRTLEALAAETGIPVSRLRSELLRMRKRHRVSIPPVAIAACVCLAAYAYWLVKPKEIVTNPAASVPSVALPVAQEADLTGLVPLTNVTYGPDTGPLQVDTNFEPSKALPDGLSIYASVGEVLWGAGDHRAAVVSDELSPTQVSQLRETVVELLRYAWEDSARRHLATGGPMVDPARASEYNVSLGGLSYYGSSSILVSVPPPGVNDKQAERVFVSSARKFVTQLQQSFLWRKKINRDMGP